MGLTTVQRDFLNSPGRCLGQKAKGMNKNRWVPGTVMVMVVGTIAMTAACGGERDPVAVEKFDIESVYEEWFSADLHPEEWLEFVHVDESAPPLETYQASFWAVRGAERELKIRFQPEQDSWYRGEPFLEIEIGPRTLYRWPNGERFEWGDSVLITVTVDPDRYLAKFEPAGLLFDAEHPAELELHYGYADSDLRYREGDFEIWRQEKTGDPWARVGGFRIEENNEIEAKLLGFTRYALAVGG